MLEAALCSQCGTAMSHQSREPTELTHSQCAGWRPRIQKPGLAFPHRVQLDAGLLLQLSPLRSDPTPALSSARHCKASRAVVQVVVSHSRSTPFLCNSMTVAACCPTDGKTANSSLACSRLL